jgi:hypothetical protein
MSKNMGEDEKKMRMIKKQKQGKKSIKKNEKEAEEDKKGR